MAHKKPRSKSVDKRHRTDRAKNVEIVSPARMELPPPDPKSVMMVRGSREKKQRKSGERAPRTALPGSPPTESRLVSLMPSIDSNSALATASSTSFANLEIRLSPPPPPKQEKEISIRLSPPPPIQEKEITITEARKLAREWCNKIMEKGAEAIGTEFKPAETTYPAELMKSFKANMSANRYNNTICLEPTRVLVPNGDPTDYYHANYVTIFDSNPKQYICAQGPMETTTVNFWKMILAERINRIVMLCDLVEKNVPKCHRYYPEEACETLTFGQITVANRGISQFEGIAPMVVESRMLEVTDGQDVLTLRHFHWVAWPDHGVPSGTTAPVELLSRIKFTGTKTLIHCAAGVGRTGTVLMILLAVQMLKKGYHPEMMAVLSKVREQRAHCVQNELQYLYAHKAILDHFRSIGVVKDQEKMNKFAKEYETFIAEVKQKRRLKKK